MPDLDQHVVNYEQLPQAIGYFMIASVALVWTLGTRGLFKKQISLQRRLFGFIFLSSTTRLLQCGVISQICFKSNDYIPFNYCDYMYRTSQALDLFSSEFNFLIYFVLSCYWAELYFTFKQTLEQEQEKRIPNKHDFRRKRSVISLFFWVAAALLTIILLALSILIFVLDPKIMYYKKITFQTIRLVVRVITSLTICFLLLIFGIKLFRFFKIHYAVSTLNTMKLAFITCFSSSCYFVLTFYNISSFVIFRVKGEPETLWEYYFVLYYIFSFIEMVANASLLVILIPDNIRDLIVLAFRKMGGVFKKRKTMNDEVDNPHASRKWLNITASLDRDYYSDEEMFYVNEHVEQESVNQDGDYYMPHNVDDY